MKGKYENSCGNGNSFNADYWKSPDASIVAFNKMGYFWFQNNVLVSIPYNDH